MWYLIVSIPDLCTLSYFHIVCNIGTLRILLKQMRGADEKKSHEWREKYKLVNRCPGDVAHEVKVIVSPDRQTF